MNPALLALAIQETPAIIDWLKSMWRTKHPDLAEPTSEDVIAAYRSAFSSSLVKDAAWLAAHPEG